MMDQRSILEVLYVVVAVMMILAAAWNYLSGEETLVTAALLSTLSLAVIMWVKNARENRLRATRYKRELEAIDQ